MYRSWDHSHSGTFKIDSSFKHNNIIQAVAHSISWDADLKSLEVSGFAPEHLGLFISTLFERSFALSKITIQNYKDSINTDFHLKTQGDTAISNVSFVNVRPQVIVAFTEALKEFQGRIKIFRISQCNLIQEDLVSIFSAIQTLPCFMKLQAIELDQLQVNEFPFIEFESMLSKLRVLHSITLSRLDIEGVTLLQTILSKARAPRHISLLGVQFNQPKCHITFPPTVTLLDVSQSNFDVKTFKSLVESLLSAPRTTPLFFYASDIHGATTQQFLDPINSIGNLHPNIFELSWSGNELTPEDVRSLLTFCLNQTNLKFLDIGRTIKPTNSPEISLKFISNYIKTSTLEGINLQSDIGNQIPSELINFIQELTGSPNLISLHLGNSGIKDVGIEPILKFVNETDALQEIDIDGIQVSSAAELVKLYNGLVSSNHLTAISTPESELKNLHIDKENIPAEVKKMLLSLKKKKMPRTSQQRLAQCEQIQVDVDDEDNQEEEKGFEAILTLKEPPSLVQRRARPNIVKSKNDSLEEINSVMKIMVGEFKQKTDDCKYDPTKTAELIMKHLNTSKKALKITDEY
ncbi:hypothetical protein GPJ56_008563 [Histomonas meleagridis]|uniref:uncharacterized protein n=1 Tax=Histomonas meleagridis TaxID=135588 RepID=UPI00355ABB54|nr:hypothetical protein GPJ56_008563 [Histomonas meleagridis]KAH0798298.1 hypothetical protein GO595_008847 [Histomonas meleagridis]